MLRSFRLVSNGLAAGVLTTSALVAFADTVTPIAHIRATGAHGMYETDVLLNGNRVRALLDTGASYTAILCTDVEKRLRLSRGEAVQTQTANGLAIKYKTMIASVQVGGVTLRNIPALIGDQKADCLVLLGMSWFNRILSVRIEAGVMTLIGTLGTTPSVRPTK